MGKKLTMLNSQLKNNIILKLILILLFSTEALATDFQTIYQSALKNSTDLVRINANSDEAKAKLKASNSSFMPKAGFESRYEEFDSDLDKDNGSSTNAFVEWNLFNGFKDTQNRKSLKAEAQAFALEKSAQSSISNGLLWLSIPEPK